MKPGQRVAIAPHTDAFMQGFRYGTVEKVGRKYVTVLAESLHYGNRSKRFDSAALEPIDSNRADRQQPHDGDIIVTKPRGDEPVD